MRVVRRKLREHGGAWRLLMRVRLPEEPSEPEVVLRFVLTQTFDFLPGSEEDKPRRVPVDPPRVIVLEQRVDMRDLRGRVGVRTRAELSLARPAGFRAGIWTLAVEHGPQPVGDVQQLTLEGVNQPGKSGPDAGADGGPREGGT